MPSILVHVWETTENLLRTQWAGQKANHGKNSSANNSNWMHVSFPLLIPKWHSVQARAHRQFDNIKWVTHNNSTHTQWHRVRHKYDSIRECGSFYRRKRNLKTKNDKLLLENSSTAAIRASGKAKKFMAEIVWRILRSYHVLTVTKVTYRHEHGIDIITFLHWQYGTHAVCAPFDGLTITDRL